MHHPSETFLPPLLKKTQRKHCNGCQDISLKKSLPHPLIFMDFHFPFIRNHIFSGCRKSKIAEPGCFYLPPAGSSSEASLSALLHLCLWLLTPATVVRHGPPMFSTDSLSHFLSLFSGPLFSLADRKIKDFGTYHYSQNGILHCTACW